MPVALRHLAPQQADPEPPPTPTPSLTARRLEDLGFFDCVVKDQPCAYAVNVVPGKEDAPDRVICGFFSRRLRATDAIGCDNGIIRAH